MPFGLGIVLLVLGLILLTGAVDLPASIDDAIASETLGWILAAAGVLAILIGLYSMSQSRRSTTRVEQRRYDDGTVERRRYDDGGV